MVACYARFPARLRENAVYTSYPLLAACSEGGMGRLFRGTGMALNV
jgi:hypothetical protein